MSIQPRDSRPDPNATSTSQTRSPAEEVGRLKVLVADLRAENARLARLAAFPEQNVNPVIEIGLEGRVRYANPAALRCFPDLVEKAGAHPWLSGWRDALGLVGGATATSRVITVEARSWHQALVPAPDEGTVRVFSFDVSDRVQAETVAARSRDTFVELVERAPFGIYIVDSEFRVAMMNAGSQAKAFRNLQPIIGRSFTEVMHTLWPDEVAEEIIGHFRHTLATGVPYFSPRFTESRADIPLVESYEWELHRIELPDSQFGVICYYFDSTALHDAERALRDSEERFRSIVETAEEGIATHGPDGTITYVNNRMAAMLGCRAEEVVGRSGFDFVEDAEKNAVAQARDQLLRDGRFSGERRLRRKDGSVLWTLINMSALRADGVLLGFLAMHTDITERKRAEQVLHDSEAELAFALELNDALRQLDDTSQIQATAARLLGERLRADRVFYGELVQDGSESLVIEHDWHRHGLPPLAGRVVFAAFAGSDYEDYHAGRTACSANVFAGTGAPSQRVYGLVGMTAFIGVPFVEQGDLVGVLVVVQGQAHTWSEAEIRLAEQTAGRTRQALQRARAEKALRQAGRDYQSLLDHSMLCFARCKTVFDSDGTPTDYEFVAANGRYLAVTGLTDVIGKRITEVVPGVQRELIDLHNEVALTGVSRQLEMPVPSMDRWFQVNLYSPSPGHFISLSTDITDRKRTEDALRDSEERLQLTLKASVVGTFEVNLVTGEGRWNAVEYELLGLEPGELPSRPETFFRFVHPEDVRELRDRWENAQQTGRLDAEFRIIRSNGEERWLAVKGQFLCAKDDMAALGRERPRQFLGINIDITERKRAERALREANATVAEASRRKDEFIAILSHELRNPLAPIRYALPLLGQESLGEGGMRAVAVIDRQVSHMTRLLDDLLDVSRIASGKVEVRKTPVTLSSVLRVAVEAASPGIAAAQHSLDVAVPDGPVWLNVDAARLSQAVTNLLNNSAKYTPRGGRIRLEATADAEQLVIRVADNGLGIPEDALHHVFEMFRQGSGAHRAQGGLGVGLSLAKQFVEMHGGTIEAFSAGEKNGAEFVIRLPMTAPVQGPEEPPAGSPHRGPGCLKVLVVDDNIDLADMLATLVEGDGHQVLKAFDGRSAISAALSYQPHLILLDVGMPDMSGIEVAMELRRHADLDSTRIVALTGWGQADDRRATAEAGFDAHVTKPADPRTIQKILEEVAERLKA